LLVPTVVVLPVLAAGSTGSYVMRAQYILGVPTTGYFGSITKAAVLRFQKALKIAPTDGIIRTTTWLVLNRSDPTRTTLAKTTSAARKAVTLKVWQASPHGIAISLRESSGRCTAVSRGGGYRGKWQMSASFWKGYGGLVFAATADKATCAQQDLVAYRGWIRSWWWPWSG